MTQLDANLAIFEEAGRMFADLIEGLDEDQLARPATDAWSVRDLVGHTTRALTTVDDYLDQRADHPDHHTPSGYYHQAIQSIDNASIAERGREAGQALGEQPAVFVRELLEHVLDRLEALTDEGDGDHRVDPVIVTRGGSMHLSAYLPTRTLELVLHCLDLARALGLDLMVPVDPMRQTIQVLSELVLLDGHGASLARALSGRGSLPEGYSVFAGIRAR
jgi:uncharacterized protein (TIGR03083 family)